MTYSQKFTIATGDSRIGPRPCYYFVRIPPRAADPQLSWLLAIPLPALFFGAICTLEAFPKQAGIRMLFLWWEKHDEIIRPLCVSQRNNELIKSDTGEIFLSKVCCKQ